MNIKESKQSGIFAPMSEKASSFSSSIGGPNLSGSRSYGADKQIFHQVVDCGLECFGKKYLFSHFVSYLSMLVIFSGLTLGCRFEGSGTKMQWAPDMADAPTSKPQKSFLDPPLHSVSMKAVFYEKTPEASETAHIMPEDIAADSDGRYLAKGKVHYETFCSVCHGVDGKGGHSLGPNFPTPPDITHSSYSQRKDGFFFYRITFGTSVMPGYGYATLPEERWMIIKHLRTLQAQ